MESVLWIALSFFVINTILLSFFILKQKEKVKNLQLSLKKNLEDDLELATSDQLRRELQNRRFKFIMICPTVHQYQEGFTVEINGIDPIPSLGLLNQACMVTEMQLRKRGLKISENWRKDE